MPKPFILELYFLFCLNLLGDAGRVQQTRTTHS